MKKSQRSLLILPLLALAIPSLSSCNAKNSFAYDLDFNVDVKGTTIKMWAGFGSEINGVLGSILDEFQRLTGVKVDYESKSNYDGCLKAVTLAATSGTYPHVVVGYPDHFASYVKSDIIVRLDYYFENDVHNPTFEPEGQRFKISDFYTDYMTENQSIEFDANGKPYTLGVPFNKSTEVLVYNKTFFNWCASQDTLKNQIYIPSTWAEVETVGQNILDFLKNNNLYNKVLYNDGTTVEKDSNKAILDLTGVYNAENSPDKVSRFKPISYDSRANLFITSVRQNGGTYTVFDKKANHGYLAFDSQETRTGLTFLKNLYDKNILGIPTDWGEAKYSSTPFKANKLVMSIGSSAGVANEASSGNKFEIGCAPVPYVNAQNKCVISQGANLALLDTGSREQRVAAWQLIKFLSKYANGYFCSKTGYFPSCPYAEKAGANGVSGMWAGYEKQEDFEDSDYATWLSEAVTSFSAADRIRADAANTNLNKYINESEGWLKFVDPPFAGSADIRSEVETVIPLIFTGSKTVDGAIKEMYSKLKDYVRK